MILSNVGVKTVCTHTSQILKIFHYEFNSPNHYISLSDNGEIIEWDFDPETSETFEICKCNLKRPEDDRLEEKKHKIRKLKKGEYYKITQAIQFEKYLALGYIDGIILVYKIVKKPLNELSKASNSNISQNNEEEAEKEEENENAEKVNEPEKNENNPPQNENEENKNDEEENKEKNIEKEEEEKEENNYLLDDNDCYNYYSLYYVLLGHLQEINSLCYIPLTKMFVSSSDDLSVKIFDMTNGHLKYYFKLDFVVNKIFYIENKNKKNIVLLSDEPYKVVIDVTTDPFTFNQHAFEYNEIIQFEKINKKYLALNKRNILLFNEDLNCINTYVTTDSFRFNYFYQYSEEEFLIFDDDNWLRFVKTNQKNKEVVLENKEKSKSQKPSKDQKGKNEIEEKQKDENKKIVLNTEFKIQIGNDNISFCYLKNNFVFCCCKDNSLYMLDIENKKELKYQRQTMVIEDGESLKYMISLMNSKKSKKKGGKDKKKDKKEKKKK